MTLWLLTALPAVAGVALLAAGRRADPAAAPTALATGVAVVALSAGAVVVRPTVTVPTLGTIPARLAVDGLSAAMVITVALVFLAVLVFAVGDIGRRQARARFHGLMLIFLAAMLATVTATNLLTLLAAWEVMGATSYALIGFWWHERHHVRSAALAFLTTRAGDLGLYLAAGAALAGGVAALGLTDLDRLAGGWRDAAVAGLVLAAVGKSAQVPFSFWLSRAMDGPTPVSALLHSATMAAAGGYLLLRIAPAIEAVPWAAPAVAWIGAVTAVALGAVALAQTDLKQLLAASTCSQVGIIVFAAGVGALAGGTLQFLAHAATKSLLFIGAGVWLSGLGSRRLPELRGAARAYPLAGGCFALGALALAGLPPLSLWIAKDQVLALALRQSPALYAVGVVAVAVSAGYAARALFTVWSRPAPVPRENGAPADWSWRLPMPPLALGAAVLGVLLVPPLDTWWKGLLGVPAEPSVHGTLPVVSAAVAVAAVGLVWVRRRARRPPRAERRLSGWLGEWLGLERVALGALAVPTERAAGGLAAADDRLLDGAVRRVAGAGHALARAGVRAGEIPLDRVVRAVGGAIRKGARWAGRPQTGLVHQYYAQALTAFLLLAAVAALLR